MPSFSTSAGCSTEGVPGMVQHKGMDPLNQHLIGVCIMEPLMQGAGGMVMVDPAFQRAMVRVCRKERIPVIFDEVFSGLWRLGSMTAAEQLGMQPDIACYAKLLTGGSWHPLHPSSSSSSSSPPPPSRGFHPSHSAPELALMLGVGPR